MLDLTTGVPLILSRPVMQIHCILTVQLKSAWFITKNSYIYRSYFDKIKTKERKKNMHSVLCIPYDAPSSLVHQKRF